MMARIPASRLAREIAEQFAASPTGVDPAGRRPAYRRLAEAIRVAVVDGRIPVGATLPSERSLTDALEVSRTTVTRAYAVLVAEDWASSRRGSGTVVKLPGLAAGPSEPLVPTDPYPGTPHQPGAAHHPTAEPRPTDMSVAASEAPPGFAAAVEAAGRALPGHLRGIGYYPLGLPALREAIAERYRARGLPTDPETIVVVPGALAAINVVARAYLEPGDRVIVESPGYPNSVAAMRAAGGRPVALGLGAGRWDPAELAATLRRSGPALALLMPDFHNPTGALMTSDERAEIGEVLRAARVPALVDETMVELALDGNDPPPPFAAFDAHTVTVGSAGKAFWGGLRVGWIRAPRSAIPRLTRAMSTLFLAASVLDQLVVIHLMSDIETVLAARRSTCRGGRERLSSAVSALLPEWEYTLPPGGLALWCRLPEPIAPLVVAAAETRGALIAAGHHFGPAGGFPHHVRLTYGGRNDSIAAGVERVAAAYREVLGRGWSTTTGGVSAAGLIA